MPRWITVMPFSTPDNWRQTLPLVYESAGSLPEHHSYISLVTDKLASSQNESHFQELITDNFLFALYHACVETFQSTHQKPVVPGLDDLENTLIKLMDIHFPDAPNIFAIIPLDDIKHHLELIDKRMEESLDSGDMDEYASIAGNIKTMSSLFLYYCKYRYALMELDKNFGQHHDKQNYVEAILEFLTDTELELEVAVQLYHACVYSRVFLDKQDKLEELFTKVFNKLIVDENINHLFDLTNHAPHRLNDFQTLIMFKQATMSHTDHGYFSQLGFFLKHAQNLLLNQTSNPYYLDLFIKNMSTSLDFGRDSPILLSLKKIQLTTDMLKKLLTIPKFSSLMLPYVYNSYFSLSQLNEWISKDISLLRQCVSSLSFLDNMKLYYLFTSKELLHLIQRQRFQIGDIDISQIHLEAFVPILNYIRHDEYLNQKEYNMNIFIFAHEAFCNIHENINELGCLVHARLPSHCTLFIGIQDILFGAKLLKTLGEFKQQMPEHSHEIINEIQAALQQKNRSMFERLHSVKNICEDHLKTLEPSSSYHHVLNQILIGMKKMEAYKEAVNSSRFLIFKRKSVDIDETMKAILSFPNDPQLSSTM